jgi:hypothetical protein
MKRYFALLAGAVAATLLTPAPAQAFPGDSVSFSVGNFTKVAGACVYHPYTMNVTVAPTTDDVWLSTRVTGPQGEFVDSDFDTFTDSGVYTNEVFICSSLDPNGTYTISLVEGTAWDFAFNSSAVYATPVTFQVFAPPAPPPPPPPTPPPPPPPPPPGD